MQMIYHKSSSHETIWTKGRDISNLEHVRPKLSLPFLFTSQLGCTFIDFAISPKYEQSAQKPLKRSFQQLPWFL